MSTTLKRQLESNLSTPERPLKRKHTLSSSPTYRYPYIPSSPIRTPYPDKPFDSPSNPFGRKHIQALTSSLPPPTAFGKHLPLQFQVIRPNARKAGFHKEGVGRIAQVPLNYTFHHLRYLIAFFFGAENDVGDTGHLFEVMKDVEVDTQPYSVGGIKKGESWIRLSGDRNPYLYKNDWEFEDVERDSQSGEGEQDSSTEEAGWKWEAEEDFSLASVWNKKSRAGGIIYYHDASKKSTQVHITHACNNEKVQRRKGRGNTPYVFWARGLVQLSALISVPKSNLQVELAPGNWNKPDAFEQFFRTNSAIPFSGFFDEDDDDVDFSSSPVRCSSTPSLTTSTSSSVAFSSPLLSTPARGSSQYGGSASTSAREYAVPKYTPAPRPVHRKRLGNMERRMHRMKRKSMEALNKEETKDDAVVEIEAETTEEDELTEDMFEEEDRMIKIQAEMMDRMSIPVKKATC